MNRILLGLGLALVVASPSLAGTTGNGWSQRQAAAVQQAPSSDAGMAQTNRDDHDGDRSGHHRHCRTTWRHHHRVRTCG